MYDALIVFVLISLLDIVTTKRALELGGREGNPIAVWILKRLGVPGLFILKYAGFLILITYAILTNNEFTIWVANILNAGVVAWNSAMIAKILWDRRK